MCNRLDTTNEAEEVDNSEGPARYIWQVSICGHAMLCRGVVSEQIDMSLPPTPTPRPPLTHVYTRTHSSMHSSMHSPMIASPSHPRSFSADPILETVTRSSPMPDSWVHGKLSPISQRMKRRGPPGFRQSLPAILTYSPSPHMIKPHTPEFRSWSRQYQPGSPGVKHDLLPIRPL